MVQLVVTVLTVAHLLGRSASVGKKSIGKSVREGGGRGGGERREGVERLGWEVPND